MRVSLDLAWQVEVDGEVHAIDRVLFALLDGIRRGGHLNYAAKEAAVSYRHAWGLVRTWESRFGIALVTLQRGRGASLTRAGHALLETYDGASEQIDRRLRDAEAWTAARLAGAFSSRAVPIAIVSSHSDRVRRLQRSLERDDLGASLDVLGSEAALRRYNRGDADAAGFHLPLGALGGALGTLLLGLLAAARDQIYFLERRQLGLMSRPGDRIANLDALVTSKAVFVNRQPGSGTRLVFDGLLGLAGIAPGDVVGYGSEEHTHSAVAATVAAGGARAGFGTAAAAAAMKLHFAPLADEHFYLAVRRDLAPAAAAAIDAFCAAPGTDHRPFDSYRLTLAALRQLHGVTG